MTSPPLPAGWEGLPGQTSSHPGAYPQAPLTPPTPSPHPPDLPPCSPSAPRPHTVPSPHYPISAPPEPQNKPPIPSPPPSAPPFLTPKPSRGHPQCPPPPRGTASHRHGYRQWGAASARRHGDGSATPPPKDPLRAAARREATRGCPTQRLIGNSPPERPKNRLPAAEGPRRAFRGRRHRGRRAGRAPRAAPGGGSDQAISADSPKWGPRRAARAAEGRGRK